ncbi:type I phosphodiesterase/nucleotide pyrophosphatase family protein [Salinisphaera dokdonensis CL-ES53]|uniref:Type I phosphodiesterase/nucleotide pyrophosphatase family protein n=1 Tax=Salinisphaera dokdonensis CL-ES53 TaxID=1304272 RepID=A0ABV2B527_9GAMM
MLNNRKSSGSIRRAVIGLHLVLLPLLMGGCVWQAAQFWVAGEQVELRETDPDERPAPADKPKLLILAIDGIDRPLLYRMLKDGELPELAKLLGGDGSGDDFPHAYFERSMVSVLPSSTAVSWATTVTGEDPAHHGVAGNEYFIRKTGTYAAPVPVTISNAEQVLKIYTEGYANDLLEAPTVYERMRETDPGVRVWVGMHQFYTGADRLILTDRTAMLEAFQSYFQEHVVSHLTGKEALSLFRELDEEVVENMDDLMESEPPADVITIYMPGLDHYAHVADRDPDESRTEYLEKAIEPMMKSLRETLEETGALEDRYVLLTSDHGHTRVTHDDRNSLGLDGEGEPPQVLEKAGFTVRPFDLEVDEETFFDTALAYQGALAYVYVADRSTCSDGESPCDWSEPAREEDVEAVAEAYWRNNRDGDLVPEMRDTLDMVLVRTRASDEGEGDVFEVYLGDGKTQRLADYLAANPHPNYVDMPERMQGLADGPHGDRAGDVILVAHNGNRDHPDERFYFASLYQSWHGSPSHRDSDIPLIVANADRSSAEIEQTVQKVLKGESSQRLIGDLILNLRTGEKSSRDDDQ